MGHRVTTRPSSSTQVVLLNSFLYGQGKLLRPRQIAQLRFAGKMTMVGGLLPEMFHSLGRRKGPVLVHRLDGVAEVARGRRTAADDIQPAVNRLTDYTIFQSDYCRTIFADHCGIYPSNSQVVLNGTDPNLFYPDLGQDWVGGPFRMVAASWSPNPRKGFAEIAQFSRLPGVELTFAGNWCPDVDQADVRYAGLLDSRELGELMRNSHVLLQPARNEACSNVIVEAMASGLPVIYRHSGGNRELAGEYGVAMSDDTESTIDALRRSYSVLRQKVLKDRHRFLIHRAAEEYLSLFNCAVARPPED